MEFDAIFKGWRWIPGALVGDKRKNWPVRECKWLTWK